MQQSQKPRASLWGTEAKSDIGRQSSLVLLSLAVLAPPVLATGWREADLCHLWATVLDS